MKAYVNACLHRGTQLRTEGGCVKQFKCPFHGFTWGLDGCLKDVPEAYRRYLENIYRRVLNITGSPVKIEFKSGENPFAGRKNKLTDRQIQRKRRLMKFVKQKK
ncbi:MAG: hypothetical protein EBW65_06965 [Gammaproteobacteria bacterium]|nr:hypothetical protein [Gammaproteobacteria bacterium]